jgi:hypothetical protein
MKLSSIILTKHCLERYREYCHDVDDFDELRTQLRTRMRSARIEEAAPDWVVAKRLNHAYVLIGKNMVLPIVKDADKLIAVTCLHRRHNETRRAPELITW